MKKEFIVKDRIRRSKVISSTSNRSCDTVSFSIDSWILCTELPLYCFKLRPYVSDEIIPVGNNE